MEFTLLHLGTMLFFSLIGMVFAFTQSSISENKYLNTFTFGIGGSFMGFFMYYLGFIIIAFFIFIALIILLSIIFGKGNITIVSNDNKVIDVKEIVSND